MVYFLNTFYRDTASLLAPPLLLWRLPSNGLAVRRSRRWELYGAPAAHFQPNGGYLCQFLTKKQALSSSSLQQQRRDNQLPVRGKSQHKYPGIGNRNKPAGSVLEVC